MIRLKYQSVDSGLGRVYFSGSNNILYCLQENSGPSNLSLMKCSKDGEPENDIAYPMLFECQETLKTISALSSESNPHHEMLDGAIAFLTRLEMDKVFVSINRASYTLIENYRGKIIGEDSGVIAVLDLKNSTVYFPSIDDSKMSGARTAMASANTIQAARDYIDAVASKETIILDVPTDDGDTQQIQLSVKEIEGILSKSSTVVLSGDSSDEINDLRDSLRDAGLIASHEKSKGMST